MTIRYKGAKVGWAYLTSLNEIGIFVTLKHQGKGIAKAAIALITRFFEKPYYLANINPENKKSESLFKGLGFKKVQHTYKLTNE